MSKLERAIKELVDTWFSHESVIGIAEEKRDNKIALIIYVNDLNIKGLPTHCQGFQVFTEKRNPMIAESSK